MSIPKKNDSENPEFLPSQAVAGTLLHPAIEMFLKCALAGTSTLSELKHAGQANHYLELENMHPI
jgi:hypothetical protein